MKLNYTTFLFSICFVFFVIGIQSQNVEKLSNDQFRFTEGPVWDGIDAIYFVDLPDSEVFKYTISTSSFSLAFDGTNKGNGLMFNEAEEFVICEGGLNRLQRRSKTGNELELLANTYDGMTFNKPNDLCIDKKGGIYFTDFSNDALPQLTNRLYYRTNTGNIMALLDYNLDKPNGVIISPDGSKLYVSNTLSVVIRRFDIALDGSISNGIDFVTLIDPDNDGNSGADGMTVDTKENLYVTSQAGVQIFNKSGVLINKISIPEKPTNCTFGGVNKDCLFITAKKNLYKIELPGVTGVRHPFDLPENSLGND